MYALDYEYRSDDGPRLVGPFATKDDANNYAASLACFGWSAEYCVRPLVQPGDEDGNERV